jgi:hypothetical protein
MNTEITVLIASATSVFVNVGAFFLKRRLEQTTRRLQAELLDAAEEAIGRGAKAPEVLLSLRRGLGIPTRAQRILEKK